MGVTVRDNDTGFKDFVKNMESIREKIAVVGVFGKSGSDIVKYATENEFGTDNIPERSFLRGMIDEKKEKISELIAKNKEKYMFMKNGYEKFLRILGLFGQDAVKDRISNSKKWAKPNTPFTIARKSKGKRIKDTPLIDTGRLRASIVYQLRDKYGQL